MPTSLFVLLCAALIIASVCSVITVYFVTSLVASITRLKASNNIWEYQALERSAKIGSKNMEEFLKEEQEKEIPSGQTQTDGTLTEKAAESLSRII